jgi:hypothetical protein
VVVLITFGIVGRAAGSRLRRFRDSYPSRRAPCRIARQNDPYSIEFSEKLTKWRGSSTNSWRRGME